jgi:hypothetical protein
MSFWDTLSNWGQQSSQVFLGNAAGAAGQFTSANAFTITSAMNDYLVGPLSGFMGDYSAQISIQLGSQINSWAANVITYSGSFNSFPSAYSSANILSNLQSMQASVQSAEASISALATGIGAVSAIGTPLLSFGEVWSKYQNQLGTTAFQQAFQNAGFEAATGLLVGAGATALAAAFTLPAWAPLVGGIAVGLAAKGLGENISKLFGPINLPQVGGVLFDNCDAVLTGIAEITAAFWDAPSGSLVLIGKADVDGEVMRFALPAMDADHLKVALRAALAGQPLGVSIDPPANLRYGERSGQMLPDGTPLIVSYLGGTAGTLYGAIEFESDRIMKCLSIGRHNQTRKPFKASIPGFRDHFEMP